MGGTQWAIWDTLFLLNIIQAAQLLPPGSWAEIFLSARRRLLLLCCGWHAAEHPSSDAGGAAAKPQQAANSAGKGDGIGTGATAPPPVPRGALNRMATLISAAVDGTAAVAGGAAAAVGGAAVAGFGAVAAAVARKTENRVRWVVRGLAFLLLWVPMLYLIVTTTQQALTLPGGRGELQPVVGDAVGRPCLGLAYYRWGPCGLGWAKRRVPSMGPYA